MAFATEQVVPDPELFEKVGVIPGLLIVVVVGGIWALTYFLRRMVAAMDRMATAQESAPVAIARLETLLVERLGKVEEKLDRSIGLAQEHVRIAQKWEQTEAPGRTVRIPPP